VLDHLNDRWEILLGDNIVGPYTWHKIADLILDGEIDAETLVRLIGANDLVPISETRLSGLFLGSSKPKIPKTTIFTLGSKVKVFSNSDKCN